MTVDPVATDPMIDRVMLGRYRIVRHLADGGMGTIYLARNEGSAGFVRPVVIKWVLPSHSGDARVTSLFMREARIMAKLNHPEIVTVLDFAEEDGMYIMALEYVHGAPLSRWYRYVKKHRGRFPVDLAVHIMIKVLNALDYAHNLTDEGQPLKIIHRDVTPSNILIDTQGHVKLADFGVAGIASEKTSVNDSSVKGKFAYLPPESFDRVPASPLTDVYSAAVTLHEVLIGTNEFGEGDPSMAETIGRVMTHHPTGLDQARNDVTRELADVVARGLHKDPKQRYQTAAQFARALAATLKNDDAETVAKLKKIADTDFNDPRFGEMSQLPALSELESAWRTPPPSRISSTVRAQSQPRTTGEQPAMRTRATSSTERLEPQPQTPTPPPAKSRTWIVIAVIAILLVLGVIAYVAITALITVKERAPVDPKQTYIVVDRNGSNTGTGSAGTGSAGTGSAVRPGSAVPSGSGSGSAPGSADAGQQTAPGSASVRPTGSGSARDPQAINTRQLTATFARREGAVAACFQKFPDTTAQALSIRIQIDASGKVVEAIALPESITTTPLGKCLADVAKATAFGPQPKATSFRVPIQATRSR